MYYRVFLKNKYFDYYSKKLMPYFAWSTLFLTQSPMFLIFGIIFSSLYLFIKKKVSITKVLYATFLLLTFLYNPI